MSARIRVSDVLVVLNREDPDREVFLTFTQKQEEDDNALGLQELLERAKSVAYIRKLNPKIVRGILKDIEEGDHGWG